jgi:hypothetical protein
MSIIGIGKLGIDYADGRLGEGLSLSRRARSFLLETDTFAVVQNGATLDRILDFTGGGPGRCDIGEVAVLLSERFPSCSVIVELPLRRPTDPGATDEGRLQVLTCDGELYAACSLDRPPVQVEAALRATDPAFMYNAIVVENVGGRELSGCPTAWVEHGIARVCALLIGAYDGEGFVLAESPRATLFSWVGGPPRSLEPSKHRSSAVSPAAHGLGRRLRQRSYPGSSVYSGYSSS